MQVISSREALFVLTNEFEKRGWRDFDGAALRIVRRLEAGGKAVRPSSLGSVPSFNFFHQNNVTRSEMKLVLESVFGGVHLANFGGLLTPIDDIDSFAKIASVHPAEVASIAKNGLDLPEAKVKEFICEIIGEPFLDRDWGGELSDILTTRVVLKGRRVTGAFLLKGSGAKRRLRPKDLGRNGDQLRRLSKQKAQLYVVQHVGVVDEAVRDQLADMVSARRAEGNEEAVGSIWDGSDCARLFKAYGLID